MGMVCGSLSPVVHCSVAGDWPSRSIVAETETVSPTATPRSGGDGETSSMVVTETRTIDTPGNSTRPNRRPQPSGSATTAMEAEAMIDAARHHKPRCRCHGNAPETSKRPTAAAIRCCARPRNAGESSDANREALAESIDGSTARSTAV